MQFFFIFQLHVVVAFAIDFLPILFRLIAFAIADGGVGVANADVRKRKIVTEGDFPLRFAVE